MAKKNKKPPRPELTLTLVFAGERQTDPEGRWVQVVSVTAKQGEVGYVGEALVSNLNDDLLPIINHINSVFFNVEVEGVPIFPDMSETEKTMIVDEASTVNEQEEILDVSDYSLSYHGVEEKDIPAEDEADTKTMISLTPELIDNEEKKLLFDYLMDENLALTIYEALAVERPDGWREHLIKERAIRNIIRPFLPDEAKVDELFEIIKTATHLFGEASHQTFMLNDEEIDYYGDLADSH